MNKEALENINRMRAVTISREYGSGGGEIAARLAGRLGWQVIDHAIVERVASELGTSLEEAEAHLYDLVLNMSLLDVESAVDIICLSLQEKATGLAKTTGELGPATGLSHYPAGLADFPSLAH